MTTLETTHLFDVHLELGAIDDIGQTPYGHRVVGNLGGGRFEGDRLSGRVLPSGGDWGLFLPDGTLVVDGRREYALAPRAQFESDQSWYGAALRLIGPEPGTPPRALPGLQNSHKRACDRSVPRRGRVAEVHIQIRSSALPESGFRIQVRNTEFLRTRFGARDDLA